MAKIHKTALGKSIDMEALRAKNERVRAVGNMRVNARGDIIDAHDRVINDTTKRVNEHYMRSVSRQRNIIPDSRPVESAVESPAESNPTKTLVPDPDPELTADELDLDQEDLDFVRPDVEIAQESTVKKSKSSKKLDQ